MASVYDFVLVLLLMTPSGITSDTEIRDQQASSDHIQLLEKTVQTLQEAERTHQHQLQTILTKLDSAIVELDNVKKELASVKNTARASVAFQATQNQTDQTVPGGANYILKFDNIVQNEGHGYDVTTGKFKTPVSGFYKFWAKIDPVTRRTSPLLLMKDGHALTSSTAVDHNTGVSRSLTFYVTVNQGETIWFQQERSTLISDTSYIGGVLLHL